MPGGDPASGNHAHGYRLPDYHLDGRWHGPRAEEKLAIHIAAEGRFVKPSWEMIWFQNLSVPTRQPGRLAYNGVLLNITERTLAEPALRESQERFGELAELPPETILEMDTSGKLTFANRNASTIHWHGDTFRSAE